MPIHALIERMIRQPIRSESEELPSTAPRQRDNRDSDPADLSCGITHSDATSMTVSGLRSCRESGLADSRGLDEATVMRLTLERV